MKTRGASIPVKPLALAESSLNISHLTWQPNAKELIARPIGKLLGVQEAEILIQSCSVAFDIHLGWWGRVLSTSASQWESPAANLTTLAPQKRTIQHTGQPEGGTSKKTRRHINLEAAEKERLCSSEVHKSMVVVGKHVTVHFCCLWLSGKSNHLIAKI